MSTTTPVLELQELDRRFHLHPFTNHVDMHSGGTNLITAAEGCYVIDQDGRRLLDGLAGLWCVNVGYNCAKIVQAVHEQMQRVSFYPSFFNTTTEPTIRLSQKLAELAPAKLNHTTFSNSGSEANESALKIIRSYWHIKGRPQKRKILSRTYAYHGVTLAATSMTGLPTCYLPFDLPLDGFVHVPGPYAYGAGREADPQAYAQWCLTETENIIQREGPDTVGALFAEPIQGAGGVIVPPDGYLKQLRALARKYDILYVSDEVISGFGRLGAWFASDMWDLDPDILVLAKGITSGYLPLGATMVSDHLADTLIHGGYFAHGFTYSGHPTCTAAALANIQVIEDLKLVERTRSDIGPYFQAKLRSFAGHPAVGEVRGYQLIGAIELLPRGGRAALTPTSMLGVKGSTLCRKQGVIVRGIRDLIAISPPLIITHAEVDQLFDAVKVMLDQLWD